LRPRPNLKRLNRTYFTVKMYAAKHCVNPLMPTLKPQNNGPLYNNTVIGTLAVDG